MSETEAVLFTDARAFGAWLAKHHASSPGVWVKLAKKGCDTPTVTYAGALDVALAWGWIDGQKRPIDASFWMQRFTRRAARSPWSKINREKALALIASGAMKPPGLAEVERAQKDGRWDAAYDSPRTATVPPDLAAALDADPKAKAFFEALESRNRYAILYRVWTPKKAETRARKIAELVAMCARGEKLHP